MRSLVATFNDVALGSEPVGESALGLEGLLLSEIDPVRHEVVVEARAVPLDLTRCEGVPLLADRSREVLVEPLLRVF